MGTASSKPNDPQTYTHDDLKNSVLGMALLLTQQHNIKNEYSNCPGYEGRSRQSVNYDLYNGTSLPLGSGISPYHAGITYLSDGKQFRNAVIDKKLSAIKLFIDRNILDSEDNTNTFLYEIYKLMMLGQALKKTIPNFVDMEKSLEQSLEDLNENDQSYQKMKELKSSLHELNDMFNKIQQE